MEFSPLQREAAALLARGRDRALVAVFLGGGLRVAGQGEGLWAEERSELPIDLGCDRPCTSDLSDGVLC